MARTIAMSIHGAEWDSMGLDSALEMDCVEYVNERDSGFGDLEGEWFATTNAKLADGKSYNILFNGTHGNDHSPGTSGNTWATLYDPESTSDVAQWVRDVEEWESKPEYDPEYESSDDDESDDD